MQLTEEEFIQKLLKAPFPVRNDVILGIGDDAAIMNISKENSIVISTDNFIEGVHFLHNTSPYDIGYKALAINLSDISAMGVIPAWMTLSLSILNLDECWVDQFILGLVHMAKPYNVALIGGDTCQGALSVNIQIHGFCIDNAVSLQTGACVKDYIYVSGTVGDAAVGLQTLQCSYGAKLLSNQDILFCQNRLNHPDPRILLGQKLLHLANSVTDVSDGIMQDLTKILHRSKVGAYIFSEQLPLSIALQKLPKEESVRFALCGGDDYELCFTVAPKKEKEIQMLAQELGLRLTCIGYISDSMELCILGESNQRMHFDKIPHHFTR